MYWQKLSKQTPTYHVKICIKVVIEFTRDYFEGVFRFISALFYKSNNSASAHFLEKCSICLIICHLKLLYVRVYF